MVREVEMPFARAEGSRSLAGAYTGLCSEVVLWPSTHLLGQPVGHGDLCDIEVSEEDREELQEEGKVEWYYDWEEGDCGRSIYQKIRLNDSQETQLESEEKGVIGITNVLGCGSCGFACCWPLQVKITVTDSEVTWSNFYQPVRGRRQKNTDPKEWKYDDFGPFHFERTQYENALRAPVNLAE